MGIYAGDISAADAWDLLSQDSASQLIDVRTPAEWQFAGIADLSPVGKRAITLPWLNYPNFDVNQSFIPQFEALGIPKETKLFFICKIGGRAQAAAAAMTSCGYKNCYNVLYGMEGDHNDKGQRGKVNGWKASKLPWGQS